ncbi:MAG: DNA polymerase III subunit gamma/tau, partial [Gammaproteobacteria bacterium]|nr:DNA polymerase III subunit gamma/tau [Gammaproteobacteria bacterium]
ELTPDYPTLLQDMLAMLHRVALAQAVPASLDADSGDKDQITNLADLLAPEDLQLFYQIGLIGQRDLQLAPDPRTGFEMILLRMIAFRPVDDDSPKAGDIQVPSNAMAKSISARGGKKTLPDKEAVITKRGDISIAGANSDSASGPGDLSQWDIVVKQLDLGGIALQLANNCLFSQLNGDLLELKLDPAH